MRFALGRRSAVRAALAAGLIFLISHAWADPQTGSPAKPPQAKPPQARMDASDHSAGWVGKAAAPFTLTDADGHVVDMRRVIGIKPFALIFYRGVWCPFCQSQMENLGRHRAEFQKLGLPVYAISNEAAPALLEMQKRHSLGFVTFLSDPDGTAARLYSGVYPRSTVHQPGVFVVDKRGQIVYAYVNQDFRTRADTATFFKALRSTVGKSGN